MRRGGRDEPLNSGVEAHGGGLIKPGCGGGHVLSRSPCSSNSNASTAIRAATHPGRAQLLHPSAVNGCRSASCLARSPISRNCTALSHTSTRGLLRSGLPTRGPGAVKPEGDATPAGKGEQPPTAASVLNRPAAHLPAGVERGRHAGERWGQRRTPSPATRAVLRRPLTDRMLAASGRAPDCSPVGFQNVAHARDQR
jgi:hypothetical protein